ncbi:MAG: hypothetical protein ABII90_08385, partial [Bacteroidota bacterium]
LNLRGYTGYLVPQEDRNGDIRTVYMGNTGAAVNVELDFNELIRFNPRFLRNTFRFKTYFFGDAGVINYNLPYESLVFADIRVDAGIGTTLTIRKWGPLQMVNPLTIRFDIPLFLNRVPAFDVPADSDPKYLNFRWIIGINRSF